MKILLLGRNGQVGWELQRSLQPLGQVVALGHQANDNPLQLCGDLGDLEGLAATVRSVQPQCIVNAAAYTAVDRAETDAPMARRVNAEAPAVLANEARRLGAWLVHYSTDYVFDGSGTQPWQETDAPAPLSVYGQTKLEGEDAVRQWPQHLILRTSWVYGTRGGNFAKTMLRLAAERDTLSVVSDQWGAPTGADLLADVTAHCLRQLLRDPSGAGTYHCTPAGSTHWCDYARHVLRQAQGLGHALKAGPEAVQAIASAAFPTPARRPLNSRLNTQRLRTTFGLHLPDWQPGVDRMLAEVLGPHAPQRP